MKLMTDQNAWITQWLNYWNTFHIKDRIAECLDKAQYIWQVLSITQHIVNIHITHKFLHDTHNPKHIVDIDITDQFWRDNR